MISYTYFSILFQQILRKLGTVVYNALDFNLPSNEYCPISHELDELIDFMTAEGEALHFSSLDATSCVCKLNTHTHHYYPIITYTMVVIVPDCFQYFI